VWMRFNLLGTNTQSFYGLPPTGKRCEMNEVGISRFTGDEWAEGWYLADGLGILLQLDALVLLEKLGCKPV
jgi:predicted ester cyclase